MTSKNNMRKRRLALDLDIWGLGVQPIDVGKTWQPGRKAAGHIMSLGRKQSAMNPGVSSTILQTSHRDTQSASQGGSQSGCLDNEIRHHR